MTFTITTDAKLTADFFGRLAATVPAKIGAVTARETGVLHRKIVQNAPVDTGRLRDSITLEGSSLSPYHYAATIYSEVEYAENVEYGTGRTAPKPYFRPAIAEFEPTFEFAIAAVVI